MRRAVRRRRRRTEAQVEHFDRVVARFQPTVVGLVQHLLLLRLLRRADALERRRVDRTSLLRALRDVLQLPCSTETELLALKARRLVSQLRLQRTTLIRLHKRGASIKRLRAEIGRQLTSGASRFADRRAFSQRLTRSTERASLTSLVADPVDAEACGAVEALQRRVLDVLRERVHVGANVALQKVLRLHLQRIKTCRIICCHRRTLIKRRRHADTLLRVLQRRQLLRRVACRHLPAVCLIRTL